LSCNLRLYIGVGELQKAVYIKDTGENPYRYENHKSIRLYKDKLIYTFAPYLFKKEKDEWHFIQRHIKYTFYPDETMQMSMYNPQDVFEQEGKNCFRTLTTNRKINFQRDLLVMNCDQELCKKLNLFVTRGYDGTKLNNGDIKILHAIETLIDKDPYTVARLIHKYHDKDIKIQNQFDNQNLYSSLLPVHKSTINKIAIELQKRNTRSTIADCLDIVINFFRLVGKALGFKTSAVHQDDISSFVKMIKGESEKNLSIIAS